MGTKYKILVVEDEQILREAYCQILTQEGYEVAEAANGRLALKQLKTFQPDLILLDILMPEMDGLTFLTLAKLTKNYPGVKVIAFSNLSDQQKLDQMVSLGVTENILKSTLSPKQLALTIQGLLT